MRYALPALPTFLQMGWNLAGEPVDYPDQLMRRKLKLFDKIEELLNANCKILKLESRGLKEYITVQNLDEIRIVEVEPYNDQRARATG